MLAQCPGPSALDHDFHVNDIVPSVSFVVNIPKSSQDSFYLGKAYVLEGQSHKIIITFETQCKLVTHLLMHYSDDGL